MRNHYRELRDILISYIEKSDMKDSVKISEEHAGLHFLLKINTDKPDGLLKEKAREKGIVIAFLSDYYSLDYKQLDKSYEHTAIINYSGLYADDMQKIVDALCSAWASFIK